MNQRDQGGFAWVYIGGVVLLALTGAGVASVAAGRKAAALEETRARTVEVAKGPRVRTVRAKAAPPERKLQLQAEARAYASVTLYAKVSGYLKRIAVDKGDHVRADQVIAVIESPEVDRQYDAATADARYKRANARRATALAAPGLLSAADAESQVAQAEVAEAQQAALAQQKSYEVLRAPFAGVVTARYADPGALMQAALGAQTGALPVVTIATPERLRVYVYVDQRDAVDVRVGDAALVTLPDRADVRIAGRVTRRADELDPRTRMMLVEVDVDNRAGRIVAGSFVDVTLTLASPPAVQVPVEALVIRGQKPHVFVVDHDLVRQRPVVVRDNDGTTVRLAQGLAAGELVALNVSQTVADGARVQAVSP